MRILYIGDCSPTSNSGLRLLALRRLGCDVVGVSPDEIGGNLPVNTWRYRLHYRTGFLFHARKIERGLARALAALSRDRRPDLVWINSGERFSARILRRLRDWAPKVLLYVNDDPTGSRDGNRWLSLRQAVPYYDLIAVVREPNVMELKRLGARDVMRVWMSYDEVAHAPPQLNAEDRFRLGSEVLFAGTWMPERGAFMAALLRAGLQLSIWGDHWRKAPEWAELKSAFRGNALPPEQYTKAIAAAKINLGLLSRGNRDLHTRRSMEIPYSGGLLCAERTSEHRALYHEGHEAVFWSDAAECAKICRVLLAEPDKREGIRLAGMNRVRLLRVGNEDVCRQIIARSLQRI